MRSTRQHVAMHFRSALALVVVLLYVGFSISAAETPAPPASGQKDPGAPPGANDAPAVPKGKWVDISDALIKAINKTGNPIPWPGNSAGLAVDPAHGDVYLAVAGNGVWKSSDQGATYVRVDHTYVTGRAETGFSFDMDPAGGRLMCFMVEGKSGMILEGGKTAVPAPASNMNFGAVDWTDGQMLIAVRHETKGWGWHSEDGGQHWKDYGPGFECVGLFADRVVMAVKTKDPGIQRSDDGGETWEHVSDLVPAGRVMRVFKNVGYWTSKKGLLFSKDQGKTWNVLGAELEMSTGPYFGKDEKNILVAGKAGLMKSVDAGETWTVAAPYPNKMKFEPRGWFGTFGWDPINDVYYASVMGQPAYRWEPAKD